ncbi:MAG TPA: hypothetical protein EYH03_03220 [Chromatiales bacterium]|nr:hypothetical protein [Chromatiales bacterium]
MDRLAYPEPDDGRDLRLDFLRGLIMIYVIIVHMEYYSLLSMFAWGRLGLVSSAEGFVSLSGLVLGLVCQRRVIRDGLGATFRKLWLRSWQLYKAHVAVILSIALLGLIPFLNLFELTHWWVPTHRDQVYALYPPEGTSWWEVLRQAFLLRIGPHQYQIIGLYVILIAVGPVAVYALHRKKTPWLLTASWALYALNAWLHLRPSAARFEYAFPLLTWQLLFFHGMALGWHRERILPLITRVPVIPITAGVLALGFIFLALNAPNPVFWEGPTLSLVPAETYHWMYQKWFEKTPLGLGRLLNNLALFIVAYYLLSRYWKIADKGLGWLLIPLGQASLYVFTIHVYVILVVSNTPLPGYDSLMVNTLLHVGAILLIWWMVKQRILFGIIPR